MPERLFSVVVMSAISAAIAMVAAITAATMSVSRTAMTIRRPIVRTPAMAPIPLVTTPVAAAIVVPVAVPADHHRRRRRVHRRRLIDDWRRRWRVVRLRRHIERRGNGDVDPPAHGAGGGKNGH